MRLRYSVGLIALFAATALQAGVPEAESTGVLAQEAKGEDRVVCRRPAAELGSRIPVRRVCRRVSEWQRERREQQENARGQHRDPRAGAPVTRGSTPFPGTRLR